MGDPDHHVEILLSDVVGTIGSIRPRSYLYHKVVHAIILVLIVIDWLPFHNIILLFARRLVETQNLKIPDFMGKQVVYL